MFEIGQIIFFQKGTHIFAIFPEAPLWLVPRSVPPINWSFVEVVLWKLIVLLPFSFPDNIVTGAKLKLGKFAIKLVGGGANIRNTDEFSLPYIQLIQLAIQVIIHHPIDPTTNPCHYPSSDWSNYQSKSSSIIQLIQPPIQVIIHSILITWKWLCWFSYVLAIWIKLTKVNDLTIIMIRAQAERVRQANKQSRKQTNKQSQKQTNNLRKKNNIRNKQTI